MGLRTRESPSNTRIAPVGKRTLLANLTALIACGVAGGVMVAAAAFPAVGFAGMSAKSASDSFEQLPSRLQEPNLPQTSYLFAADGKLITTFFDQNRVPTPLKRVPMVMRNAMIAAEDARFMEHSGVDPQGVVRAFVANQGAGEVTQGASTLTQQYVRNVLMATARNKDEVRSAVERTFARKLREMRYAAAVEQQLTKEEILERYLDIAFFGNNGYGIGAAAQVYYSQTPEQITLDQAAMLAGLVKSPTQYNPLAGPSARARAKERRDYILQRMVELKFVAQAEADKAMATPLVLKPSAPLGSCVNGSAEYGFFCDWFLDWWKSNPAFGSSPQTRLDNLRKGGYRITAAVDPTMQAAAQKAADGQVRRSSRFATGIVLVEPGTGRVKAMAITRTYSMAKNPRGRDYPNTVNPLLTGSTVSPGYQAGSTFKMFTMVAALRAGMPLSTRFNAPFQYRSIYTSFGEASCGSKYCPKNASPGMSGTHAMWSGFGESVNTYFIQLQQKVTVKRSVAAAEDLGIVFRSWKDKQNRAAVQKFPNGEWGSFTLGTALVPPLDMANAYATVAARGRACEPLPIQKLTDRHNRPVDAASPDCRQVIAKDVADAAADAARCPVGDRAMSNCARGNGVTAASVGRVIDRPIAGKTGTTDANRAAWFVGFTPNLAGAAFYVDPDAPNTSSVPNSKVPIEVFKNTMRGALTQVKSVDFVKPTSDRAYGKGRRPAADGGSRWWRPRSQRRPAQAVEPRPERPAPAGAAAREPSNRNPSDRNPSTRQTTPRRPNGGAAAMIPSLPGPRR